MTIGANVQVIYSPVDKCFYTISGNKGAGGIVVSKPNTWETVLRIDSDYATAAIMKDGTVWGAIKTGQAGYLSVFSGGVNKSGGVMYNPVHFMDAMLSSYFKNTTYTRVAADPHVASDELGNMYVVAEVVDTAGNHLVVLFRWNGTTWDKAWTIANSGVQPFPRVVASNGQAHVIYRSGNPANLYYATLKDDVLSPVVQLNPNHPGWDCKPVQVSSMPDGTCFAVYPGFTGGAAGAALAVYTPNGLWKVVNENAVGNNYGHLTALSVASADDNKTCFITIAVDSSNVHVYRSDNKGASFYLWREFPNQSAPSQVSSIYGDGKLAVFTYGINGDNKYNGYTEFDTSIVPVVNPSPAPNPTPDPNPAPTPTPVPVSTQDAQLRALLKQLGVDVSNALQKFVNGL